MRWERQLGTTHILGFVMIPQHEQLIQCPFDTMDLFLLSASRVFRREGGEAYVRPIGLEVKIEKSEICKKQGNIGTGRRG